MKNIKNKQCGITGHRNIINYNNEQIKILNEKIDFLLGIFIKIYKVNSFLCGMAVGADLMIAKRIIKYRKEHNEDIKIYSVIPCENQDLKWRNEQKREYREVLKECEPSGYKYGPYTDGCMSKRNKYIVNNSDFIFAIFDENIKKSGTAQVIRYAIKNDKCIYSINPKNLRMNTISSKKE